MHKIKINKINIYIQGIACALRLLKYRLRWPSESLALIVIGKGNFKVIYIAIRMRSAWWIYIFIHVSLHCYYNWIVITRYILCIWIATAFQKYEYWTEPALLFLISWYSSPRWRSGRWARCIPTTTGSITSTSCSTVR